MYVMHGTYIYDKCTSLQMKLHMCIFASLFPERTISLDTPLNS